MGNKSVVLSIRINEGLQRSLDKIAGDYKVSVSHLVSAVLTSFSLEYAKSLVEHFSITNEDEEGSE